ncbi:hypothetical protein CCACVL1_20303 [Corchorus capsularis]|uniref:Pentacotripeptide-repeat region of PRORP domain-containing protein n=1 Tax=Corchorus capsularis TaxID=210143 RepID=A0A1R3HC42_COCAP|nr:hypothetical protein CCACVL1_20303 [Corchorus capsularis]
MSTMFPNCRGLCLAAGGGCAEVLYFSDSSNTRPFPDYSPKKPTIRDSDLVRQISVAIKARRSQPLFCVLKPYQLKFRSDHLIWVLMNIKGDYGLVLDFFEWACLHRGPTLEARCIIVQIVVASKDTEMARQLIHDFWLKPKADVGQSFCRFVECLIYTYKDWGSDPNVFDIFFQVLVEAGMLDEARKLFDKMLNYGLIISVDSCNAYLNQLKDNFDGLCRVIKVFIELREVGACWNTASYNIIMHSLCQQGKNKEAHRLLLHMELKGCIPDVVSYSTIVNGYCHVGKLQKVLRLIEEMQKKELKPNLYTYNNIIYLLCKNDKVVETELVLREMMNQETKPDNVIFTTLIDGFCKLGNISSADRLLNEMHARKIIPDLLTYTSIISGFCRIEKMTEASNVFQEMLGIGLKPDEVTYMSKRPGPGDPTETTLERRSRH